MGAESRGDQVFTRRREPDDPGAPVTRIVRAMYEFLRLQPIYRSCDGSAGQQDAFADHVHGLRPLVKQQFKDGEVGKAEPQPGYAAQRGLLHRLGSFPQDQPHVHLGIYIARAP